MSECLLTADMLGASPQNVLLVGISGKCYGPGHPLSAAVRHSVQPAIDASLHELQRLGLLSGKKSLPTNPLFVERSRIFGSTRNARINNERRSHPAIRSLDYSIRSVTAGSIRIIRNVGKKIAAVATTAMRMGTAVRVSGS
jgi:hypothetical protein